MNLANDTKFLSPEETELLLNTTLAQFSEDDKQPFVTLCNRTFLDPFTKQIHATERGKKKVVVDGKWIEYPTLVPVISYEGLLWCAERTGEYDGNELTWAADEEG